MNSATGCAWQLCPLVEGPAAAVRHLRQADPAREDPLGGGDRDCPRAGRVRVGRDDRLTPLTLTPPQAGRCSGTHAAAGPIPAGSLSYPAPDVSAGPALRNTDLRSRHAYRGWQWRTPPLSRPGAPPPPAAAATVRGGPLVGPGSVRAASPASRLLRIACGDGPAGRPGPRRPAAPGQGNADRPRPAPRRPGPASGSRTYPSRRNRQPAGKWTARKKHPRKTDIK